jgi:hypothetical protein
MQIKELSLHGRAVEEVAVDALTKLERGALGLNGLSLSESFEGGDQFIKNVVGVISLHEVGKLFVNLNGGEGGLRVLKALGREQWRHIRVLKIDVDRGILVTCTMMVLEHGPIELDYFHLSGSSETASMVQAEHLKSFVASTSIKHLVLYVTMTPSDMASMVRTADVSRLEEIQLRASGYSSSLVDRVLSCLKKARNLRRVDFSSYTPTPEQEKRMQKRGVSLFGV